jgi:hypothetical protein
MAFPQSTEYAEAIQNSQYSFIDPELRSATNDGPTFMGLPGGPVASGNFSIVYRFRTATRKIAVKCFTREKTDQQARYSHIHNHLITNKLPWTVDFSYVKEGIRVKAETYPVLKMEWIENGQTLLTFLNESINANASINSICDQFYQMASDLKRCSIAHGDLQHGNLIISNGKLMLIDYDGMCVPRTAGLRSEEDGLPDYQHPRRRGGSLNSAMDHFSILVIWTSLYALTVDPTLWSRWVRNEERLLFSREDFLHPEKSPLIRELRDFKDAKMTIAVEAIVQAVAESDPCKVPHLIDIFASRVGNESTFWWTGWAQSQSDSPRTGVISSESLPDWMESPAVADSITTFEQAQSPVGFTGKTTILSLFFGLSVIGAGTTCFFGIIGILAPPVAFVVVLLTGLLFVTVMYAAFYARPEVQAKNSATNRLEKATVHQKHLSANLQAQRSPFVNSIKKLEAEIAVPERRVKEIGLAISDLKILAEQDVLKFSHSQSVTRNKIIQEETDAIAKVRVALNAAKLKRDIETKRIQQAIGQETANYSVQKDLLSASFRKRVDAKLDSAIQVELSRVDIASCPVGGVSTYLLKQSGFYTLADFVGISGHQYLGVTRQGYLKHKNGTEFKIKGIGEARCRQLDMWRTDVISSIRKRFSAQFVVSIERQVAGEIELEKNNIEWQFQKSIANLKAEMATVEATFLNALATSEKAERDARSQAKVSLGRLVGELEQFRSTVELNHKAQCERLNRELWKLQSVVSPTRHKIRSEMRGMENKCADLARAELLAQKHLRSAELEASRYNSITVVGLLKYIFS